MRRSREGMRSSSLEAVFEEVFLFLRDEPPIIFANPKQGGSGQSLCKGNLTLLPLDAIPAGVLL